jgi:hypothetical protein
VRLPAVSPDGRLLYAEVLFDSPGIEPGFGEIVHAVEWDGSAWNDIFPATERWAGSAPTGDCAGAASADAFDRDTPGLPVLEVAYGPAGRYVLLTRSGIVWPSGVVETPDVPQTMLVASDGAVYLALAKHTGFTFFHTPRLGAPWEPIGGMAEVVSICESQSGAILAAGQGGIFRGGGEDWPATPSWRGFGIRRLVAHPSADLVVALGRQLLISVDDGRSFLPAPLPGDHDVEWMEVDPSRDDTIVCVSARRRAFQVKFERS